MLPLTILRYVALACCDLLAGTLAVKPRSGETLIKGISKLLAQPNDILEGNLQGFYNDLESTNICTVYSLDCFKVAM